LATDHSKPNLDDAQPKPEKKERAEVEVAKEDHAGSQQQKKGGRWKRGHSPEAHSRKQQLS